MTISPNTDLLVLRGVPFDNSYVHTSLFSSAAAQENWFRTKLAREFDKLSYQRVGNGQIKVQEVADELYDCNYLMFRNTAFGDKWFYAFLKSVDYVNNVTCVLNYEIDVMQTWMFDYSLNECYVEREHALTDEVGDSTTDEPVSIGPVVCHQTILSEHFDSYGILLTTGYVPDSGG